MGKRNSTGILNSGLHGNPAESLQWISDPNKAYNSETRQVDDANTSSLEYEALSDENNSRTIQLLGESLDKVVATTKLEDENRRLRRENDALKKRLESESAEKRRKR